MAVLRVGSVGLRGVSVNHVWGINDSPDLELVALCDIDPEILKKRAEEYNIPEDHCFTDYRDLIACPDVDVVDISTPNDVHVEIAAAAARAGKSYGVEKPIAFNAAEAEELAKVTRECGVRSMVFFSYRYRACVRYMQELLQSGRLGRIHHVNMRYYQGWATQKRNAPLVWRFEKAITGSGALGDLGCHALDLVSFVTGEKYLEVSAHMGTHIKERRLTDGSGNMGVVDVDDFANINARMTGDLPVSLQITRLAYARNNYQCMEIFGEEGALIYYLDRDGENNDELEICDESTGNKYVSLEVPKDYKKEQMRCWAHVMNGCGDGLDADADAGLENQKLLDAIVKSAENGQWVPLN